ncbi:MAG: efflux RND transporter periplasmic adaptor subunit [Planctomycetaceae bacterium]|nr:efflux RND transporter periplasmic adaptor subunit [Planctomycetaceae bacterium]
MLRYARNPLCRLAAAPVFIAAVTIVVQSGALRAHENHAPLPTKGVRIVGDQIMISAKGRDAIGMTTAKIALTNLRRVVGVNARVELPWRQQAMIASLVSGKIEQALVRPGETVAVGQELARVASTDLESLQSEMLQAATEVRLAQRIADQRTILDKEGVIAGKNLLEARLTLAQTSARLEIARQKLAALGLKEDVLRQVLASGQPVRHLSIVSPMGGTITHADVRVGQNVQTTDHLYHVVDSSTLWIVGEVLEAEVAHLRKGQEVSASLAALPGRNFRGQIDHIRLKMDQRSRTQAVVIAMDNSEGLLRPGMFGRVDIEVQVAKDAVFCPSDALIETRVGTYVLVERGEGKYVSQPVKLGLHCKDQVEILDGLFPGDRVVVVGNYLLASLMGNEHKARVKTGSVAKIGNKTVETDAASNALLVAQATVELPTDRKVFAASRLEGRLSKLLVDPSQPVRAGQVLAEIDSLQLQNLQLELLQTRAKMRWTKESLKRLERLTDLDGKPKRYVWQLQSDLEVLQQNASGLEHQLTFLGLAQEQLQQLEQIDLTTPGAASAIVTTVPVRAPADGWLVGFHVVPGQVVQPQDKLFEVQDLSKVWAKGYVFERDAARVHVGQEARVTFSAYPDLTIAGKVVRTAPTLESSERVLPVWVEVDNPDLRLKEGMLAKLAVSTETASEAQTARRDATQAVLPITTHSSR